MRLSAGHSSEPCGRRLPLASGDGITVSCAFDLRDHVLRRHRDLGVAGQRQKLRLAGALQPVDVVERLADGLADREQAVIAQDHHLAVAEVLDQPLPLVESTTTPSKS